MKNKFLLVVVLLAFVTSSQAYYLVINETFVAGQGGHTSFTGPDTPIGSGVGSSTSTSRSWFAWNNNSAVWHLDFYDFNMNLVGHYDSVPNGSDNTININWPTVATDFPLTNTVTTTSNFVVNAVNNLGVTAQAVFKSNGVVVKVVSLSPGASASYTATVKFPQAAGASLNLTSDVTRVQDAIYTGMNSDYAANASTSGLNINSAGVATSSSGGNTGANGNQYQASASSGSSPIIWSSDTGFGTGAATESTLKQGFQATKQGLADVVDTLVQVDNSIKKGSTNSINVAITNSPYDAGAKILQGISNQLFGEFVVTSTFDTNGGSFTNDSMLGYHWELQGDTNYGLAKIASDKMADDSGLKTIEDNIKGYADGIVDFSVSMNDFYPPVEMRLPSSLMFPGGMDFDPLHNQGILDLFDMARKFFMWGICLIYLTKIVDDGFKIVMLLNDAHGVNPAAIKATLKKTGTEGLGV